AFLRDYFRDHAFGSMTTDRFEAYITDYYQTRFDIRLDAGIFDAWIRGEGLPENVPAPKSERFARIDQALAGWRKGELPGAEQASAWSTHEWLHFLRNLPQDLSLAEMTKLDSFGHFTESQNAEIITVWGVLAIRNQYE